MEPHIPSPDRPAGVGRKPAASATRPAGRVSGVSRPGAPARRPDTVVISPVGAARQAADDLRVRALAEPLVPASVLATAGLDPIAVVEARLRSGSYDSVGMTEALATRLIASGDLVPDDGGSAAPARASAARPPR